MITYWIHKKKGYATMKVLIKEDNFRFFESKFHQGYLITNTI